MTIEEDIQKANVKGIIFGAIVSALGFLVALSWRDSINETIILLVPRGQGLHYQYASSIIITIIVVVIAYIILKVQKIHISNIFGPHNKPKKGK